MASDSFIGPVALLYTLCSLLLGGLALFVLLGGRRRPRARARLRRTFFLLALSLLGWVLALFLEVRSGPAGAQLWLGRANFAAAAVAAPLALRFVQEVAGQALSRAASWWPLAETALVSAVTLLTPLVDAAERVEAGRAVTTFGPLFPGYLVHVVGYLAAALVLAFRERRRAADGRVRGQLALVGAGMLVTGGVALVTNAVLPYSFDDFRFCDVGTLSTLAFVMAVAYATFIHRLFDLRVVVRETLVYGLLLAFVLGTYSAAVFLVTQILTGGAQKLVQFAVLVIAFSFDPLRRFLEEKTDRLLFGERGDEGGGGDRAGEKETPARGPPRPPRAPLPLAPPVAAPPVEAPPERGPGEVNRCP